MSIIKVASENKDRKVGAMIKALAVEISDFEAVKGTTKEFLQEHGHYLFYFPNEERAAEFKGVVQKYISPALALLED